MVLNGPISQFLQDSGKHTKPTETAKVFYFQTLDIKCITMETSQQQEQQEGSGYLFKAHSLRRKLKKYFIESVNKNCNYGELVEGIDSMTG